MKKNFLLKNICLFLLSFSIIFAPMYFTHASAPGSGCQSVTNSTGSNVIKNPLGSSNGCLSAFINSLLLTLTKLISIVAVIMIILAGLDFVLAAGNEEKIKKAKTRLFNVMIGTAIILGASLIADVISNTITSISSGSGS